MYVFDASAIVNLIKKGEVKALEKGVTLDLALYESLNAIWKECHLLKKMEEEIAKEFVEILKGIFEVISIRSMRGGEIKVLELAFKEGITAYDASYLALAMEEKRALVTDDKRLRKVASKYVKTLSTSDLLERRTKR